MVAGEKIELERSKETICEWVSESERVDWIGDRCRDMGTEFLPSHGYICRWHLLIAKLMAKRCARCEDPVYDHEADAIDDAEYGIEATDLSLAEAVRAPGEFVFRTLCQYCDHVTNKDD